LSKFQTTILTGHKGAIETLKPSFSPNCTQCLEGILRLCFLVENVSWKMFMAVQTQEEPPRVMLSTIFNLGEGKSFRWRANTLVTDNERISSSSQWGNGIFSPTKC
jgi:hypothetical protein